MNRSNRISNGHHMALKSRRFSNANIVEMRKQGKHPRNVNAHPIKKFQSQMAPYYLSPHGSAAFMIYRV